MPSFVINDVYASLGALDKLDETSVKARLIAPRVKSVGQRLDSARGKNRSVKILEYAQSKGTVKELRLLLQHALVSNCYKQDAKNCNENARICLYL